MPALAVDLNELLSTTHVVDEVLLRVELAAQLIRVGDLELGAEKHIPFVRRELTEQEFDHCGFTDAVAAHNTHAIAALNNSGEVVHHRLVVIAEGDASRLGNAAS